MGERRKYTAEFKREAVELRRTSDKTIAQIARELGISLKLLEGNRPALEAENARHFLEGTVSRLTFIEAQCGQCPIRVLCETLGVWRSGYYARRGRPPSARERRRTRGCWRRPRKRILRVGAPMAAHGCIGR